MDIHLPTLLIHLVTLSSTLTLVVGALAWRSRDDGLPQLTAGLALHTLAFSLVLLRGRLPDPILLSAANFAMPIGYAVVNEAICRFQRRRPPRLLLWAPPVAALLLQPWLISDAVARVVVIAVLVGVQCATSLALLAQRRSRTVGAGQYLLAADFLVVLAVLLYRVIVIATLDVSQPLGPTMHLLQTVTLSVATMTSVVMAMGFVIMTREAADQRNRVLAMSDELTGLDNRRSLMAGLGQQAAQARRIGMPLSVLVIDIDRFKAVNDTFGHVSGDVAIRTVSAVMRGTLRDQDVLGRLGGEEFLAILPATPAAGAVAIAERLRMAVESTRCEAADGRPMPITISIGLHEFDPRGQVEIEEVMRAADSALYRAKADGRNRVVTAGFVPGFSPA